MFKEESIGDLVNVLIRRRTHLYHACQYSDFLSYVAVGGIPSRARLQESERDYTAFETDRIDQENAVWDKVFLNLSDFGTTFARSKGAIPNPYGPVLLRIQPEALKEAVDIAVCLRSAGAQGFRREQESLRTPEEIDRLFSRTADDKYPASTWIKFATELQKEFRSPGARDPEISCTYEDGVLPIKYVDRAIVDPYVINDTPLWQYVRHVVVDQRLGVSVYERKSVVGSVRYNELANLVREATPPLGCSADWNASEELKHWAREITSKNLEYQYNRFAQYLREGTLQPLST